jgi:hypothetical protein
MMQMRFKTLEKYCVEILYRRAFSFASETIPVEATLRGVTFSKGPLRTTNGRSFRKRDLREQKKAIEERLPAATL